MEEGGLNTYVEILFMKKIRKGWLAGTCESCQKEFEIKNQAFVVRQNSDNRELCKRCYMVLARGNGLNKKYCPEFMPYLKCDEIKYEDIMLFIDKIKSKKSVVFLCKVCNKTDKMSINAMNNRKICGSQPICRKCSLSFATQSDTWKLNNSLAQTIAQNRPETLKKQRDSQLRLMAADPLYADKRCSKSYISGHIRGFRFDSSWELYFIVACWERDIKIERHSGFIKYNDSMGVERKYFPDFLIDDASGRKKIVEIKGSKSYNNFLEKFNAARTKYGADYFVIEEKDMVRLGLNFRSEAFLRNFYIKYNSEITFFKNKKTDIFKERIKSWLK